MYRLLIVDDEPLIVDWLTTLFASQPDLELEIFKAYKAADALNWAYRTKIDIVVSDIYMPEMDGLQLMEKIKEVWPGCKYIFLTGYNKFEYAFTAIRNEVIDYILKNEDDGAVIAAVHKAVDLIASGTHTEALLFKARQQMELAIPLLQKEYLIRYLDGAEDDDAERLCQFDKLQIPLQADYPALIVIGRVEPGHAAADAYDRVGQAYLIKNYAEQLLNTQAVSVFCRLENQDLLWFVQPIFASADAGSEREAGRTWDKIIVFLEGSLETMQTLCKKEAGLTVSFGMSTEPLDWSKLAGKYYALRHLLNAYGGKSETLLTDRLYRRSATQAAGETDEAVPTDHQLKSLEVLLERGNRKAFFQLLEQWIGPGAASASLSSVNELQTYYKLALLLLAHRNDYTDQTDSDTMPFDPDLLLRPNRLGGQGQAIGNLFACANSLFDRRERASEKGTADVIHHTKRYIDEHLGEDLTLVMLAELVYLNPSYLSRLFKQATGINLFDYILNARIARAKELLQDEQLKIYDIASRTGFGSPSYFIRTFRKETGRTPQEYREQHQQNATSG